jgi:purine-nucleoside/S-methyl-5'-thioadenosine phosphorylase / adenosine deaminase
MREDYRDGRIGLAFEGISRKGGLRHVFTTRDRQGQGNLSLSGGRDRDAALAERATWSNWLAVDAPDWVVGGQVHGAEIAVVDASDRGRGALDPAQVIAETDGLITVVPGLPLYVAAADCAAVLLYAPGPTPAVAVLHAGWRGLAAGVLSAGVAKLAEASGAESNAIMAGIAPCIGLNNFEVGPEVCEVAPEVRRVQFDGQWHVDLAGWANDQLRDAGLTQGHIEVSGLDSMERPDLFFSHRRDGEQTGRMGLIAVLE